MDFNPSPEFRESMQRVDDYVEHRTDMLHDDDLWVVCRDIRTQVKRIDQADTVRRLNELTPEHNGRVHAEAVDAEATLSCGTDSAHGAGVVHVTIYGSPLDECADCGVAVVRDLMEMTDGPDYIDVEVYR